MMGWKKQKRKFMKKKVIKMDKGQNEVNINWYIPTNGKIPANNYK